MHTSSAALLTEFEHEAIATGRLLERLPAASLSWRPHPRSLTLGALALHIATIPGNLASLAEGEGVEAKDIVLPEAESLDQIREAWRQGMKTVREKLTCAKDPGGEWSITIDQVPAMTITKDAVRRLLMLNHWYHHRGQLTVYLRLLDVPIPAVYGWSADDNPLSDRDSQVRGLFIQSKA